MHIGLFKPPRRDAARACAVVRLPHRCSPRTKAAAFYRCALFGGWCLVLICLVLSTSCTLAPTARTIRLEQLEAAGEVPLHPLSRGVVSDPTALEPLLRPLGRRMALLEVRSPAEWEALSRAVPGLGGCPNLARGAVIGLVSRIGLPLSGEWPTAIERIRVSRGAGLLTVRFAGGSFLPDGTTYVELAQVEGLEAVLVVDMGGTRFFPQLSNAGGGRWAAR